jgi:hypothetical protein
MPIQTIGGPKTWNESLMPTCFAIWVRGAPVIARVCCVGHGANRTRHGIGSVWLPHLWYGRCPLNG